MKKIAESAKRNCCLYVLNIPTNGSNPGRILKKAKRIAALGIPRTIVTISLDGPEEFHDSQRGAKGAFKKSLKCFALLKTLENDFSNFRCLFEFTISPYNFGLFEETLKGANTRVGCTEKDFQFTLFHISENFYANKELDSEYSNFAKNAHKEAAEIRKKLTFSLSSEYLLKRIYLSLIEPGLKNPLHCGAANNSIF
ncbi:MAG: hypothetical protein QW400_02190 [Candidatus Diapherotrites archaeon]